MSGSKSAIARLAGATSVETHIKTAGPTAGRCWSSEPATRPPAGTVLEINPKLAKFYGPTQWTQIDWEQRQRLRGKPLALWLHGLLCQPRRALPAEG